MGESVRRARRRNLIMYLKVFEQGKDDGEPFAHLVDISDGGMMLMSGRPIDVKKDYKLGIRLPYPIDGVSEIKLSAHCLWCEHTVNDDVFDAGFRVDAIDYRQKQTLQDLLDEYGLDG